MLSWKNRRNILLTHRKKKKKRETKVLLRNVAATFTRMDVDRIAELEI